MIGVSEVDWLQPGHQHAVGKTIPDGIGTAAQEDSRILELVI